MFLETSAKTAHNVEEVCASGWGWWMCVCEGGWRWTSGRRGSGRVQMGHEWHQFFTEEPFLGRTSVRLSSQRGLGCGAPWYLKQAHSDLHLLRSTTLPSSGCSHTVTHRVRPPHPHLPTRVPPPPRRPSSTQRGRSTRRFSRAFSTSPTSHMASRWGAREDLRAGLVSSAAPGSLCACVWHAACFSEGCETEMRALRCQLRAHSHGFQLLFYRPACVQVGYGAGGPAGAGGTIRPGEAAPGQRSSSCC